MFIYKVKGQKYFQLYPDLKGVQKLGLGYRAVVVEDNID